MLSLQQPEFFYETLHPRVPHSLLWLISLACVQSLGGQGPFSPSSSPSEFGSHWSPIGMHRDFCYLNLHTAYYYAQWTSPKTNMAVGPFQLILWFLAEYLWTRIIEVHIHTTFYFMPHYCSLVSTMTLDAHGRATWKRYNYAHLSAGIDAEITIVPVVLAVRVEWRAHGKRKFWPSSMIDDTVSVIERRSSNTRLRWKTLNIKSRQSS